MFCVALQETRLALRNKKIHLPCDTVIFCVESNCQLCTLLLLSLSLSSSVFLLVVLGVLQWWWWWLSFLLLFPVIITIITATPTAIIVIVFIALLSKQTIHKCLPQTSLPSTLPIPPTTPTCLAALRLVRSQAKFHKFAPFWTKQVTWSFCPPPPPCWPRG